MFLLANENKWRNGGHLAECCIFDKDPGARPGAQILRGHNNSLLLHVCQEPDAAPAGVETFEKTSCFTFAKNLMRPRGNPNTAVVPNGQDR